MNFRTTARVSLLGATAFLVVACAGQGGAADTGAEQSVAVSATYAEGGDGPAYTYDTSLVPAGSTVEVSSNTTGGSTTTTLQVTGLVPNRAYGSHVHTKPCGPADGADAGPHYQLSQDPVTPSVDPAYANPQNEIWLDFTTDAEGNAEVTSTVPWSFPPTGGRPPSSSTRSPPPPTRDTPAPRAAVRPA